MWLFFIYSFLGWVFVTLQAAVRHRRFVNSGLLAGPFLIRYGVLLVFITLFGRDLRHHLFFLFIGTSAVAGFLEWAGGWLLEHITGEKWWDHSDKKFTLDGHVTLFSAVVNGLLGVLGLLFINPLLLMLADLIPPLLLHIILWVMAGIMLIDAAWVLSTIFGLQNKLPHAEGVRNRLLRLSVRLSTRIFIRTEKRFTKTYPKRRTHGRQKKEEKPKVFAEGLSFAKLFWLFFIGSFLGAVVEIIYCRIVADVWMSRSSLVWGQFSVVWGLAFVLATVLLYNYRDRSDAFIFCFAAVVGGVYEYICSVFTELVFGQIFWDYSHMPFNLGGRINLLFCFFWGIAAVIWLKKVYPFLSAEIEKIPPRKGRLLTAVAAVFMAANMLVSSGALIRSTLRSEGIPPKTAIGRRLDKVYNDDVLERIYPNARLVKKENSDDKIHKRITDRFG